MTTTVRPGTLRVPGALPGPESPLPALAPLRALPEPEVGPGASAEMLGRIGHGRLTSPLPYPLQSDYDRGRRDLDIATLVLDNGEARAVVVPGLGGRVWSLVVGGRELLHRNPVLQPAGFGLTDAWVAGGIEWNLGSTGHGCLSSRPVHAGVVRRPGGDLLRLWEWERTRDLVWQTDLTLDGPRLVAHTRVANPDPEPTPLYWWTNVAVPETEHTRVLSPATHAWRTDYGGRLTRVALPDPDATGVDVSRARSARHPADYFFEVADDHGVLAAVEPSGQGLFQTATPALTGRKLFVWGESPGADRWQEWLSGPGARYCEVQAGLWPTQLEHGSLPGGAELAWTEVLGALDLDPGQAAAPYAAACAAARGAVRSVVPTAELDERHATWLREVADAPPTEVLATGSGWGRVELALRDSPAPPGRPFPEVDDASRVALGLLRGESPDAEPDRLPVPPVSDRWLACYESHPDRHGWWVSRALGVALHLRGRTAAAATAYEHSLALRPTPGAAHGLALLRTREDRVEEAAALLERARLLEPDEPSVAVAQLRWLLDHDRSPEVERVIADLPAAIRGRGRVRLLRAQALARLGHLDRAAVILADLEVPDLAEGDRVLDELWRRVRPDEELPAHLDFRMVPDHGDVRPV